MHMPVHSSLSFCVVYEMSSGKIYVLDNYVCIQLATTELLFRNMDWKLCLICQKATKEVLKCPLERAVELTKRDTLEKGDTVAWASYHASNQNVTDNFHLALTQLMPLFYEKATTAAMVKHGMVVQHRAT